MIRPFKVPSWFVVTKLSQLSMLPQTGNPTNSPSLTPPSLRTEPSLTINGLGISLSPSTARHTNGLMEKCSSRLLKLQNKSAM